MVEFICKVTGVSIQVADERADEYKAAGYKLAAAAEKKPVEKQPKKQKG